MLPKAGPRGPPRRRGCTREWATHAPFLASIHLDTACALLYSLTGPPADVGVRPLRRAASPIGRALQVPLVCFGHSHDEELWHTCELADAQTGWYGNTGTSIAVLTHDVLLPRDRVQYTFPRVCGQEGRLMHWSPKRGQAMPVVLLDDAMA